MTDPQPVNPRFEYDDDPEIRAIEQQLERPALLAKAARAQARARRRMRLRWLAGGCLLVGGIWACWKFWQPGFPKKKAEPVFQNGSPALPDSPAAPLKIEAEPILPQKETPQTPFPAPKRTAPNAIIAFDARPADFAPDLRPAVEALLAGRIETAGQRLAMAEKAAPQPVDVRSLDDEEEARLDTLAYLKGLVFLQARRFPEATAQFSRLDEAGKPWREEAQFYLFQAHFLLGKKKEADLLFEKIRRSGDRRFLKMAEEWRAAGH